MKKLFLLMLLLALPLFAAADSAPEYEVFTFADQLPAVLAEPLSPHMTDDARILSGALIRHNSNYVEPDEPASLDAYSAMLLADTPDGLRLLAAAWVDGLPWQVNDFTHLLRWQEHVSIGIYGEGSRIPMFRIDYAQREHVVSDLMIFRGNRLWQLTGHINETDSVSLMVDLGVATVKDAQGQTLYNCDEGYWMEYLDSIDRFPTSRAAAEALDAASMANSIADDAVGCAYTEGATLRTEPTAESASLGLYNRGVPLSLTGLQHQGTNYPWLQVQIGDTQGWMAANYVIGNCCRDYPVPIGRNPAVCAMYAAPGDAQPISQLEPGMTFHILTEVNGMYHICIPQGEISWQVDREGIYGYIATENILTGAGVLVLDALTAAE